MLLLHPLLVATNYMLADMVTKALEKSSFVRFRNVMMNCNGSARDVVTRCTEHFSLYTEKHAGWRTGCSSNFDHLSIPVFPRIIIWAVGEPACMFACDRIGLASRRER